MSERVFALTMLLVSGTLALLGAIVAHVFTERREVRKEKRLSAQELIERTRTLYVDALRFLEVLTAEAGRGEREDQVMAASVYARLVLAAPADVLQQYDKVGDALEEWAKEARAGAPKPIGGGALVIGSPDKAHRDAAAKLWPQLHAEMNALRDMMKEHLGRLEGNA